METEAKSLNSNFMSAHPLQITYSGDTQVLHNILLKKELLAKKNPAHKKLKTVLILPGGGQRGVIEAGVVVALEKLGLVDTFDYVIGISTGAAVGYYTLGREAAIGSTIYFDDNVKNHFVNFLRLWKVIDFDTLERVFREKKPIDMNLLRTSRPKFFVSVTDKQTGKGKFVDVKSMDDPLVGVIASLCVPVINGGKSVLLNDRLYVDGGLSNPFGVKFAIEELGATDIFVAMGDSLIPRVPYPKILSFLLRLFFSRTISSRLRREILEFVDRYNKEQIYLRDKKHLPKGVRLGIIHPKVMPMGELTMSKKPLQEGVLAAMTFTEKLFLRLAFSFLREDGSARI